MSMGMTFIIYWGGTILLGVIIGLAVSLFYDDEE